MNNFEFATAARIVFGAGKLKELRAIAGEFGQRALFVHSHSALQAATLAALPNCVPFSVTGEPTIELIRAGIRLAKQERCDVVVSLGGGSVIDAGKAIAALVTNGGDPLDYVEVVGKGQAITKPGLPFIAIPTTAGTGAEVTRNAVLFSPEHHVKVSLRGQHLLARVALVDPELTYNLPPSITANTGLDALTQLIEPFVSCRANPLTGALCREGMQRVARSLRQAYATGAPAARADMALASLFGGLALANAGLGAVHGFAAPLGGMYDAPHGALCAALLPAVMTVNERAVRSRTGVSPVNPDKEDRRPFDALRVPSNVEGDACPTIIQRFEEVRHIVGDLAELGQALGVKPLRELGVRRAEFPVIIEKAAAASSMKGNPIQLTTAQLGEILELAWEAPTTPRIFSGRA